MNWIAKIAGDKTGWTTAAALVAALVSSIPGFAHFAPVVRAAIDAGAALVASVFVAGRSHVTASGPAASPSTGSATAHPNGSTVPPGASAADIATALNGFAAQLEALSAKAGG